MPRITVHAVNTAGEPRRWTLSERIVAEHLDSDHYINQLVERLAWATADAESQEVTLLHPQSAEGAEVDAPSEGWLPRRVTN